jgi:hypothetical protein
MAENIYTGVAASLEAPMRIAHAKIKPRGGRDFTVSKVSSWGVQFGGFTQQTRFWVELVEDPDGAFRPDG